MNSFGRNFRISIFGESHGAVIGVCIDGCPAGTPISSVDFTDDLLRRKSGKKGTTPRMETDLPDLVSGVYNGHTTGAPLTILFYNEDVRSEDYAQTLSTPRPGHADFVASKKFKGFDDPRGGGHFSGRLTLALVAAGVIARKLVNPIAISARLVEAGGSANVEERVEQAMKEGDSIGGIVECKATNMPIGLGEPFFDTLESLIAHIIFAIPGIRGIEFGSGFASTRMKGSEHNDIIETVEGKTATNNAGGINGGISNGNDLLLRVAVKPTSSIVKPQRTMNFSTGAMDELKIVGRHDSCIALRMPVIIEAAVAIVLADLMC